MNSGGAGHINLIRKNKWSLITALLILGLTMGYVTLYMPIPVALKQPLDAFPSIIGEWVGHETRPEDSLLKELNNKDRLDRVYQNEHGGKVALSIRYFPMQTSEQKIVGYLTDGLHEEAKTIPIPTARGQVEVNAVLLKKNGAGADSFFWYDINGKIMTNRYKAKMESFLGTALKRKTNGAIVVISNSQSSLSSSSENDFLEKSILMIHDFLHTE
jgi:EpsI family protein